MLTTLILALAAASAPVAESAAPRPPAPVPASAAKAPGELARELERLLASPRFAAAREALRADHARLVDDIVTLTEIPAPPFGEEARGRAMAAMMRAGGLPDAAIDGIGNVIATRRGTTPALAPLIVAAHLDTVFPAGTDVKVRREGTRLMAPGIGDDTLGLAVMLAMVRAMDRAGIRTERDIVFIANVGEEGPGDLRGMRHFFAQDPRAKQAAGFITIDGAGAGWITTRGVGSRRWRLVFDGPGGHSFDKFGIVNPLAALARTVTGLYGIPVPAQPRTTYSASVVGGGTSVNTIPAQVFLDVDIRSESPAEIDRIDTALHAIATAAVDEENRARSTDGGRIAVTFKPIGNRPAGTTPETAPLAVIAATAARAAGFAPHFEPLSTDANVPMNLGIPAIAIGAGGDGGGAHAPSEWIDVAEDASVRGAAAAMATVLGAANALP
ncbi:M20/M25/M40 family metallo-hydrolase [Novosphingobium sp.]|uniref:M20/M25/M40 family metallo-hydrolase n=1 Tax=Novosphingobium sp. TaxID=1874826 RepID=UPI003529FB80